MILETRAVPPFMKNGWIIGCSRTRDAVVVDPGDEVDELLVAVREVGVNVRHILLSHAHIDHVTGVAAAVRAFQVPVHMHRDDLFLYERVVQQGTMFGMVVEPQPTPDLFYDGTPVHIGDVEIRAHHTPGHCPGEVCLEVREQGARETHLFVGDSLFAGSIGRTDLPGGNYEVLMQSITKVIMGFGDDAIVHPGHGPDTTVRRERTRNPFVLEYLSGRARS